MPGRILLIDNYDSFTYNLYHFLCTAGAGAEILRNDSSELPGSIDKFDALVISPGPSSPANSGLSRQITEKFLERKPVLGVCLGMQIINEIYGGRTMRAEIPVHGKVSEIELKAGCALFKDLPQKFKAARYHSLICADIKSPLRITAAEKEIPMALDHQDHLVYGVQFHPESFLTEFGQEMINNFVSLI